MTTTGTIILSAATFLGGLGGSLLLARHYARKADLDQLRRWAREDGLKLTERAELRAHYSARYPMLRW